MSKKTKREKCWQWLKANYPVLFDKHNVVPLEVGVTNKIIEELPEWFHPNVLRQIVAIWTKRDEYQDKLILDAPRYGVHGQINGRVTQEHLDKGRRKKLTLNPNAKRPRDVGDLHNR